MTTLADPSDPSVAAAEGRRKPEIGDQPLPVAARRILFLGTHGQANIGDELLLETFLSQLGNRHHYAVNSYDPEATSSQVASRFDVSVFDTAGSRAALLRNLRSADVVVFGGGSIVKELYRSTGRRRHATLIMVLAIVVFARLVARRPVLMSNVGVGPLPSRGGRFLAARILRLVDLISVRDQRSYDTCIELGCRPPKLRLAPDAVWVTDPGSLDPDADVSGGSAPAAPPADGLVRIALNLNKDVEDAGGWDTFLDRLVEGLDLVSAAMPIEIHALPMQSGFKDGTDLDVLVDVLDRVNAPTVVHTPADHHEVVRILRTCDVVVSERFHAIVLAAIVGRPVVALPYDVKVRELARQLCLEDRAFDVGARLDPRQLALAVEWAAEHRHEEGARLAAVAADRRREAERYFADVRAWIAAPSRRWLGPAPEPRPG